MASKPLKEDPTDKDLVVGPPKRSAVGLPSLIHSMPLAWEEMGPQRGLKTLLHMNQKDGFDCMSCAWPDPPDRKVAEFCENGAKAVSWEADTLTVPTTFWAEHPVSALRERSEYWLGQQGRLIEPVYKPAGFDHYRPISWDNAFGIIARELNALDSPDEATFYTSGRASNEAAFAYQLFARAYGTNNLPDCSNMCHESTGKAMAESIGVGKAAIHYEDFAKADLIIIMGQNPGTNHPRMLTALEEAKLAGTQIVAVNPLLEAGLINFKNPQRPRGLIGRGVDMADQYLQVRLAGDMALLQAVSKRVFEAEDAAPGSVLDHKFLREHCIGLQEYREHLSTLKEADVLAATGLESAQIDELTRRYLAAENVIITWAMGLTQHKKAVPTIKEIMNLLLLRGNIGKPGAGPCPIRGHSNVQGDRTMGIWEQMPEDFMDRLAAEFDFNPPRKHGLDAVQSIQAMHEGKVKVFVALGGNLVSAISDTAVAQQAMAATRLSVQISTKLNLSHAHVGEAAIILPTLGRSDIDVQASGPQFVTVEDTLCAVHASQGRVQPVSQDMRSEVAIISDMARAVLGDGHPIDWEGFRDDYDVIREHISHVAEGCEGYNVKVRRLGGFILAHPPRDERRFPTPSGKAVITVNELEALELPPGRLILQSLRSHDQFNTTTYSLNDRYRGIKKGRNVIFVNPDDLRELGFADGGYVDVHSESADGHDRVMRQLRLVTYPTARGCAAAYFPEANVLVALADTAEDSNTPVSKSVIVRLEHALAPDFAASR
ncbi:FdhF/YdeP family oxidoreductase [Paeniglutamicibacter cryotolerans]|uniref:Formate dehydrogenase major subunit n=1 Tax=Paeniglutamicibacter cryotolerans TaxID=670079 RepID=A0A839QM31_9MICC|nr:FdhF/YdeP family oxidoreductase [Paeniglutamicibacter cryotolerans]MBB2997488.1 formate dehydrogenase major subunit [Paeniglutamicibacter cryotolerans]